MPLELKIISEHAELVGDDRVRSFQDSGGTIGRSLHSDWILPDPSRFISSKHATIDCKAGVWYLADTSSNGVFVNEEAKPIGKGNPRRLFNGDHLRMGAFEIAVSIDAGENIVVPPDADQPSVAPDNMEQFVDEDVLMNGMQMLEEEAMTGEREFHSALLTEDEAEQQAVPSSMDLPDRLPAREVNLGIEDKAANVTAEDLFDSFLDGLGINRAELQESVDRPAMMLTAGQVLRQFVTGTTELLASRADLKNTFRLDQTTVLPRNNNPMKFTENTNDLLKQLLVGHESEYLGAQESIREVCKDLMNHQNAFLDAMSKAFIEFAERFEPEELQDGFDRTIGRNLFSFNNKTKYWQLYCELYPILTEKGGGRFPQMFSEEFVKAYEQQIAIYRREDPQVATASKPPAAFPDDDPEGMATTQIMDNNEDPAASAQPAPPTESVFDEDDIVDVLSGDDNAAIDQSFIDDLENSLAADAPKGQAKA